MVFSAFPLSALAADVADVAADNAWKRMLEIGIVDEDGDLIEDTAFTLADGREAYSITEFLDMIDAEDTDPDMAVTVWGNGSVATVQEIVYALSIEYQMKDITSSVRYLSENGAAANENDTADTNAAPQAESLPRLTYEMELYGNMFNVYFRLEDADGNSIIASEDITFDVGLFGDVDGIFEPELEINTAYKFKDLTGVNTYLSRTLEVGKSSIYVSYNVPMLKQYVETIYDYYNKDAYSKRPDFLDGALPFVVQVNNLRGAVIDYDGKWTDCATIPLAYERSETVSVDFECTGTTVSGSDITTLAGDDLNQINKILDEGKTIVLGYVVDLSTNLLGLGESEIEKMRLSSDTYMEKYLDILATFEGTGHFDMSQDGNTVGLFVKYSDGKWYHDYIESGASIIPSSSDGTLNLDTLNTEIMALIPYSVSYTPGRWDTEAGTTKVTLPEQIAYVFYESKTYRRDIEGVNKIGVSRVQLNKGTGSRIDENHPYTAPNVKSVSVAGNQTEFYVGQSVPILVEFSEPVKGSYYLNLSDGTKLRDVDTSYSGFELVDPDVTADGEILSASRLFLYEVKAVDNTEITVNGVSGVNSDCKNYVGVEYEDEMFEKAVTLGAHLNSTLPEHSIGSLTVVSGTPAEHNGDEYITYTFSADTVQNVQAYRQLWASYNPDTSGFKAVAVIDGDFDSHVVLTIDGDDGVLEGSVNLPKIYDKSDVEHSVGLYILRGGEYIPVNSYASFTEKSITTAPDDAYELTAEKDTLYITDAAAYSLTVTKNQSKTWTYDSENDYELVLDKDNVLSLSYNKDTKKYSMITLGVGEVKIHAATRNGKSAKAELEQCSNEITVKVLAGSTPTISFPTNANTYLTRAGDDCTLMFASNLSAMDGGGDFSDKKIAVQLKEKSSGSIVWETEIERYSNKITVPGEYLTKVSTDGEYAYAVTLTAEAAGKMITASGYIVVLPQPAAVEIDIDGTTFVSGKSVQIGFKVEKLKDGVAELWVEKDGTVLDKVEYSGAPEGEAYEGGLDFTFEMTDNAALKENFLVMARARNNGDDAWSTDSRIVTVYRSGALDIEIGGEKKDSFTLKNRVESAGTTTSPTITNTSGETISGLDSAEKIAGLRSELGLLESISINKSDFAWGSRSDMIKWSADADIDELRQVLTLNYRQGSVYEPLSNFSYLAYIPDAILMLCGLNEGTATVTAQHNSVEELSDTVEVKVEKLKDKLYLFGFTPAVETKLTYTDGKGEVHNVKTNTDGSLALYEPNGIASDVNCYSEYAGEKYLGTVTNESLKSGEGNGTKGELYPMNAASLRKAAVAEIVLTKPDGTPYVGNVTVRGGVYRNLPYAENREDAYCTDAKFSAEQDEPASMDGKRDMTFTTDANGKLTVYMDMTQFTTKNDASPIDLHEDIQYIFELRIDGYYPSLVTVDSNLTVKDVMRKGENRVSLAYAENPEIFVASQTVDYGTGRKIKITQNTSRIGPNATYPTAEFDTTVMLWGVNTAGCDYDITLRQQNVHKAFSTQNVTGVEEATYPFSSIKLIRNTVILDESAFEGFDSDIIKAEYRIYDKNKVGAGCVISVRPKIVNLINNERIQDSDNLLDLMTSIALFSSVDGAESSDGILKRAGDKVIDASLKFVTSLGSGAGLVKCVLTPTEDPARFTGYFWTGMNTLKMDDLEYENGICVEPTLLDLQLNDTFSVSDFKSMADGSYFDDKSSLWGAVSNGVIGLPVSIALEGWFSTDIRYNLDKGEWEVLMTGGGFTAGAELQYETARDILVGPAIPVTYSIKLRGGVVVDFKTAIRYAEELGEGWDDEKAKTVNDYLTALRINAYVELFGGLGKGKNITCKMGAFGSLEIDNENRFLTKNYLQAESLKGQYLSLEGTVGIKVAIGMGPVELEVTVASIGLGYGWYFNDWNDINDYWYGSDEDGDGTNAMSLMMGVSSDPGYVVLDSTVRLQSMEYLKNDRETYFGEGSTETYGARRSPKAPDAINQFMCLYRSAYPYIAPLLTDDAEMIVFLDDFSSIELRNVSPSYSVYKNEAYQKPIKVQDKKNSDFPGYGDYTFDLDGTYSFAALTWLRQSATLGLKEGTELTREQQYALLSGSEVMASIWNGAEWTTVRLTDNAIREDSPTVAASDDSAIVVWKQIQTGEEIGETVNDALLYKLYKGGTWGDTFMLYSGDVGEVLDIDAKMLSYGTAAVAYSVSEKGSTSDGEIYYSLIDTESSSPADTVKTVRVTENDSSDISPVITKTLLDEKEVFVLAWHKTGEDSGVELNDIGFVVFGRDGTPESNIPDSLASSVSISNFDGLFTLTNGAESLTDISVVWRDKKAGKSNNDIIKSAKLGLYDGVYAFSAPTDAVVTEEGNDVQTLSASSAGGKITTVYALEYPLGTSSEKSYEFTTENGETVSYTIEVPDSRTDLYYAHSYYGNAVEVNDIMVDFTTLAAETPTPISFTVTNMGVDVMTSVDITIDGKTQSYDCRLMPGEYSTFCYVYTTGETIENLTYTCTAEFDSGDNADTTGDVFLDYPDVGISGITVTKQSDRVRVMNIGLYNQSASTLTKAGRYVRYGVYSDSDYTKPIDGKYFADGTAGEGYTFDITSSDKLSLIDEGIFTVSAEFKIGEYVNDLGMTEIPSGGVNLFVRAEIVENDNVLPESDKINNNARINFESLIDIRGEMISADSYMRQGQNNTSVDVVLSNNSLEAVSGGNVIVSLYDEDGALLETKRTYGTDTLDMTGEEVKKFTFDFGYSGSYVLVWLVDDISEDPSDSSVIGIYLEGTDLTIDSFDENNYAELDDIERGQYSLTVIPSNPDAKVYVDGELAENGVYDFYFFRMSEYTITIVSTDGSNTAEYKFKLNRAPEEIVDIRLEKTDLTLDSFDRDNYAEITDLVRGKYKLTVTLLHDGAEVYVDGELAKDGIYEINFTKSHEYKITSGGLEYRLKLMMHPEEMAGISLDGAELGTEIFDESNYAELQDIVLGNHNLKITPLHPDAKIFVDGKETVNGEYFMYLYESHEYKIVITSPDGKSTVEYKLKVNAKPIDIKSTAEDLSVAAAFCTLTFETNGGDYIRPLRKICKTVVDLDKYVPERDGYEFTGWYTDSALTNCVTKVRLTRNMTVYAGWEKISADEEIVEEYEFPFTDVYDRDWFFSDVAYVAQNGLMRGTSSDKFSPYSTTTRAMIVTVLYRMEGEPDAGENSFIDVPDGEYYTDAVAWASENGIVNGYGQGRFGPNDSITREQLAAILYRYSVYKGYDVSVGEGTNILSFDDIAELSDYAFTSMQWACGAGLIGGMGDGRLAPKGNATRCQIAAVLHRYCDNFGE